MATTESPGRVTPVEITIPEPAPTPGPGATSIQPATTPRPSPTAAPPFQPPAPPTTQATPLELTEEERRAGAVVGHQHVTIPRGSFRSLMQSAADGGRAAYEAEILSRLDGLPFSSIDDLLQAIDDSKQLPPPETSHMPDPVNSPPAAGASPTVLPPTAPTAGSSPGPAATPAATPPGGVAPGHAPPPASPELDTRALPEATRKRVAQFREDMKNRVSAAEAGRTAAEASAQQHQATIERMRAEETLKISLASTGVGDFDFAWHQLQQHIAQLAADKSPEGVERFTKFSKDPRAAVRTWAEEQRTSRPYLFGVAPVPATTGAPQPGAPAPTPPSPAAVAGATGTGGQFDARQASPTDFAQRMKQYGINYAGRGQPFRG